jgi:hypothetical protein
MSMVTARKSIPPPQPAQPPASPNDGSITHLERHKAEEVFHKRHPGHVKQSADFIGDGGGALNNAAQSGKQKMRKFRLSGAQNLVKRLTEALKDTQSPDYYPWVTQLKIQKAFNRLCPEGKEIYFEQYCKIHKLNIFMFHLPLQMWPGTIKQKLTVAKEALS